MTYQVNPSLRDACRLFWAAQRLLLFLAKGANPSALARLDFPCAQRQKFFLGHALC